MRRKAGWLAFGLPLAVLVTLPLACSLTPTEVPDREAPETPSEVPTVDRARVEIRHVDTTRFPQLTAYVRVFDTSGQPVDGLTAADFSLAEDGEAVSIASFVGPGEQAVAATLVVDVSGSMQEENRLEGAKAAARTFVSNLREGRDQAGLVAFSAVVETLFPLQPIDASNRVALERLIDDLQPEGGTAYYDAVYQAVDESSSGLGRRVVVALTDGQDNRSAHSVEEATEIAQIQNVPLYTISLGGEAAEDLLEWMANSTGGEFYQAPTAGELASLYEGLARGLQEEYALTYTTPNPVPRETARSVKVAVTVSGRELVGQLQVTVAPTPTPPLPTATPTPESPYPGGLSGRIVFTRNPRGHQDATHEIHVLDLETGTLSRLTNNAVADWDPDWSPDGRWIAFVSFQSGNYDIWVMRSDGSEQTRRIALDAWDDYPTWSPDGSEFAFVSTGVTQGVPNSEVFVGSATGSVRQVTVNTARDEWPSWAPDGRWLACSSDRDGDMDIYLFAADGGEIVQWTDDPGYDEQPAWSPDGEWIAFVRKTGDTDGDGVLERRDDGDFGDLWIGRRDGSEFRCLIDDHRAADPAWSPDGRHVVFTHARDTTGDGYVGLDDASDLWVVPVSGGDPIVLLEGTEQDWSPDWAR